MFSLMMLIFSLIFFINTIWARIGTCQIESVSCPATANNDGCCTPTVGIMVFAQQWIVDQGPPDSFTIHGLWPNFCNGSFTPPRGCDSRRFYRNIDEIIKQDIQLYNDMNTYWPSNKKDNPTFWSHEWNKHGTCLSTQEPRCFENFSPGMDVRNYFQAALKVRQQYNLYELLAQRKIIPGRIYPRSDFKAALASLGGSAEINCVGNTINEIRSTFHVKGNETLIMIDSMGQDNCPEKINYPLKTTNFITNSNRQVIFKHVSLPLDPTITTTQP